MLLGKAERSSLQSSTRDSCSDVPCRNIRAANSLVRSAGFDLHGIHVGGVGHRNLRFYLASGEIFLRFVGNNAQVWRRIP